MKRFFTIIITLSFVFSFSTCSKTENENNVNIGVIDSCISCEIQEKYHITEMNDIIKIKTDNNITHGSMVLSIILENVSKCEIFYCSVLNEKCVGEISHVAEAIDWCIDNDVDIITMSFATLTDNKEIRESVERAIKKNIVITASCINLSDMDCYPAMYDGVISVSEGFNNQAKVILEGKTVEFSINGTKFQKREVSFLTAYVCATIANQISKGKNIEEILNRKNLNKIN